MEKSLLTMNKPQLELYATLLGDIKNRILNLASHEFRTPLTSIASSADLLETYLNQGDYDKVKKHVARIKKSVTELDSILNRVLAHGKLEAPK